MEIPQFRLYGEGNAEIENRIQPKLALRSWGDLNADEKKIALRDLRNRHWLDKLSREVASGP